MKKQLLYTLIMMNFSYFTLNTMDKNVVAATLQNTATQKQILEERSRTMWEAQGVLTVESDDDDPKEQTTSTPSGQSRRVQEIQMIPYHAATEELTAVKKELDKFEDEHKKRFLEIETMLKELTEITEEKKEKETKE